MSRLWIKSLLLAPAPPRVAQRGSYATPMRASGASLILAIVLLLIQPACAREPLDLASEVLAKVAQNPVRKFSTRTFGRDPYQGAISALVSEQKAPEMLKNLRKQLPRGTIAFIGTTHSLANPPAKGVELVVAPGKDQFDILRVAASDAVNFGMLTEDLIRELRDWDREFGVDIGQADTDTIVLELKSLPKDINAFAKRVYKFCPDIVDQGTGDIAGLANVIRKTRQVYLWWD
jgi:Domain of unknown function (DUF4253)